MRIVTHEDIDSTGLGWFVLIVRGNLSLSLEDVLRHKGFEAFAPYYRRTRQWADRTADVDTPLFPGYIFIRLNPSKRLAALTTPGVFGIVEFDKKPAEIDPQEIDNLKALIKSGLPVTPHAFVKRGDRVRITDGPLRGVSGIVVDNRKTSRIVVSVKFIERAVSVEVDRDTVRAWQSKPPLQLTANLLHA